jgi:Rhs element Vgr protein
MANTPYTGVEDTTLLINIKVNGSLINDVYGIMSIQVNHTINKISTAEVQLRGEVEIDSDNIPITDSDDFSPGADIEILVGYNGTEIKNIFKGVIVKHIVELNLETYYTFRIVCKHLAVKMTYNTKDNYFLQKKDSDIISSILGTYGLSCTVDATTEVYENMYQKMATDWDFILARAEFNGLVICKDGDNIKVSKPDFTAAAILTIEAGVSIISFEGSLNAEYQPSGIEASAWDPKTLTLIKSTATEPEINSQGNMLPKDLPAKLSQAKLNLISTTPMTTEGLKTWADSTLLRKRLSAFKGRVKFIGNAEVKTGSIIAIDGVGKKLNGDAYVSGVSHTIDTDNWNTTVIFGLENNPIYESEGFSFAPATGQLPAMQGVHLATVKKIDSDPISGYRVQVALPSLADTEGKTWARLSGFYASGNAGSYFMPELGDEVLVSFLDNDPRYPVILGSLYNGKNAPPYIPDAKNFIKAIVTKSNLKLEFNDEKKIITLVTPGNNTIIISDDGKSIEIKDQNANSIKLGSEGIVLDSAKDINLKAKGNINIDASVKASVSAKADVAIAGLNINATAQVGISAKGSATAELSASGQTTVKGAIVMIN